MHNASFEHLGFDAIYLAFDVPPDKLISSLQAMADLGFAGVNLTVPLKEVAFRGLADLDDSARVLGAVNTVQFLPSGLKGYNTDGLGFVAALQEAFGISVAGKSVFVLGSGGAGRAVAITCAKQGAQRIRLADLEAQRCAQVVSELRSIAPAVPAEAVPTDPKAWAGVAQQADLVVHATPVGMRAGDTTSLLDATAFRPGQLAFDLVYTAPETGFVKQARMRGASAVNGLGMLLHQGAAAFTIWTGRNAAVDVMRKALETAVYGQA
jgi:shikimate dehydrogenase